MSDDSFVDELDEPVAPDPSSGAGDERGTLKQGMGFAASSFLSNLVVQLLSSVLTARLYGVDTIGEYALVTAPWLTLIQFSSVAEQTAMVRTLSVVPARDAKVARTFFSVLGFSFTLTTFVSLIVGVSSVAALRGPIDQPDLVAPALVVLLGYVLVENVSWNMDSVFSAFRAGREIFIARFVQAASFLVLAVGLRAVSESVWSLALATALSFLFALLVRLPMIRRYVARPRRGDVRQGVRELPALLRFSLPLVPGSLANGLSSQAPTWLLGGMTNVATVGSYSRAAGVAIRIQDVGFRLSEMVFPAMVERQHNDDRKGMQRDLGFALRGSMLPLILVAAVGGGVATTALKVFGEGFDDAADAFALLLGTYSLTVLSLLMGQTILALGNPWVNTSLVLVRSACIVALLVPGIALYDETGAAGALFLGYVLDVAIRLRLIRRRVFVNGFHHIGRSVIAVVIASVPAFAVARVLDRALVEPLGLLAGGVAGSITYVVVVVLLGGVSADERQRMVAGVRERLTRS
ncbi:MAG TPA: oligosaccharide flippase family protein [Acidimicrobiales bacterium]|nr:oligosaccharide flippase family protein [Acidimicrobiales bacterium]